MKNFTDLEKLELYAQQIHDSGIDITQNQKEWTEIAYVCASQGEAGRNAFHLISSLYPGYSYEECNKHYTYCLKTSKNSLSLGTLVKFAENHGIELMLPTPKRGRPRKTDEVREEERKNQFEQVSTFLNDNYQFRYNTLSERVEVKLSDGEWYDFSDRELNEVVTRMHENNVKGSKEGVDTYVNSNVFSTPYNPVVTYLESLKPWSGRVDYIRKVFDYLHLEEDADVEFLFECFKLWFVCFVGNAADLNIVNQQIIVLMGEKEGTGKTEFILRLLPKPLQQYIHSAVQLSNYKDKDELLALPHNMIFLLDEISLNQQTFNKLKNLVGGAGANIVTERVPFGHYSNLRKPHASFAATTNHIDFLPDDLGNRRFLVLPVISSNNYDDMPIDKAFAQAFYLATHPRRFSTKISPQMITRLKEINQKYVSKGVCEAVLPTVLRKPYAGEQGQAVTAGEIIAWLTTRTGPNRDYTPRKVNAAMRKSGFKPEHSNKGNVYIVKRVMSEELKREGEMLANQDVKQVDEQLLPF